MNIKTYLDEKRVLVNQALEDYMLKAEEPLAHAIDSMRYSLFAGGKRIRPILCLAGTEAVGGNPQNALPVACALECIHTYSLIHDDLPAMDNDDLRRGKPTNHKIFGEAQAILAGDGLLTFAFELLSNPDYHIHIADRDRLRIIYNIAGAAGPLGMVGGQSLDIRYEGRTPSFESLRDIHRRKTGALITASVQAGAIAGAAHPDRYSALTGYGEKLGLSFQIVDDLLNVEGTAEQLGKAAGTDAARHKATYPGFFGVAETRRKAKDAADAAVAALNVFGPEADHLRALANYVVTRNK